MIHILGGGNNLVPTPLISLYLDSYLNIPEPPSIKATPIEDHFFLDFFIIKRMGTTTITFRSEKEGGASQFTLFFTFYS